MQTWLSALAEDLSSSCFLDFFFFGFFFDFFFFSSLEEPSESLEESVLEEESQKEDEDEDEHFVFFFYLDDDFRAAFTLSLTVNKMVICKAAYDTVLRLSFWNKMTSGGGYDVWGGAIP